MTDQTSKPARLRPWRTRIAAAPVAVVAGLRVFARGAVLVARISPWLTAAYLAISALLVAIPVSQVWLAKVVVDRLAVATTDGAGMSNAVLVPALLYVLTLLIPATLHPILETVEQTVETRAVATVDRALIQAGMRLTDLYRIERPTFHDELRLLQRVVFYLPAILQFLHSGVGTAFTVGGLLVLVGSLHPLLPLLLAVAAVPHLIVEEQLYNAVWKAMQDHSRAAREMDYSVRVATEPAAAKEVRLFGLGGFFLARFHARFAAAHEEVSRIRGRYLRRSLLFGALYGLTLAGGLWYVASRAGEGTLTLGDVALYVNTLIQFQIILFGLPIWFGSMYEALPYFRAFMNLQDEAGPLIAVPPPGLGLALPDPLSSGVALDNVSFAYPDATQTIFADVVALLPSGKVTALVGANGAGKSTLVKLLTRMYDPTAGRILLDGVAFPAYDLADLRANIAVVYQDFAHFALTLRDNVLVGTGSDATDDIDTRIAAAMAWSGADEVAAKLDQGAETELTRRFEGGVELSGGEWQKVALARGAVRPAPLLILDEPNAALDADAEHHLLERFRELASGRTVLLISHRLSTVRQADHILVLEDGRIVESGRHDELVAQGGRYATLYQMQAGRYWDEEGG